MNKSLRRLVGLGVLAIGGLAVGLQASETALVKKNRVNVRGQATLQSEVITQLNQGEVVTILEEVELSKPRRGEPKRWAKIQLPANTPVWVFAPYVEPAGRTINIRRLNIRSGPGERFSILGRLERGAAVKEIRTVESWMEIEAPTNTFAFVALEFLEKTGTPTPAPDPALAAVGTNPPTSVAVVPPGEPVAVVTDPVETATAPAPEPDPAATTPTEAAPAETAATDAETVPATPEPAPRRLVSREGKVVVARSVQAPTDYALEGRDTHLTINYLHSEDPTVQLRHFAGRKVIVTGEELLDQRWANTPIIEVESIRLVP